MIMAIPKAVLRLYWEVLFWQLWLTSVGTQAFGAGMTFSEDRFKYLYLNLETNKENVN